MKFLTTEYRLSNEESRDMLQMLLNWRADKKKTR